MADEVPKRKRGRPPKEGEDVTFKVTLPKHHYDYLEFLAVRKHRLGSSAKQAAEYILTRELDAMFTADYHAKEIPAE